MTALQPRDIPVPQDPLGETLYMLGLKGTLFCQSELTAPWGVDMPAFEGKMMFHIVMSGECWLSVEGQADFKLQAGSLVLLPKGRGHSIASRPDMTRENLFDIPVTHISDRYEMLRYGGDGETSHLMCGVISFDHVAGAKLIAQLPGVIHIDNAQTEQDPWLQNTLQFMAAEARTLRAGGETIMAHLADIVIIKAIRHWIENAPEAQQGWLGALRDPKIGKALSAIHAQPAQGWTVDELAQTAGMSRSGFAARFTEVVGTSVKQYLTQWRMHLARARLLAGSIPLGELAEELGYQSEAAFSRAYKRIMGESPVRHSGLK